LTELIQTYGALGVFLLMVPESACIPVPSEVTLLFAGVAVHQGWLSFPLAVLAATAGDGKRCSSATARAPSSSPGCCRSRARSYRCPRERGACRSSHSSS
jgi:hypothetical protein